MINSSFSGKVTGEQVEKISIGLIRNYYREKSGLVSHKIGITSSSNIYL